MGYLESIYNNTRYIVFIQTKYHQNIKPANDVSPSSLRALLEGMNHYRGYMFRSIRIQSDDITRIKVYEMNFINYKENVLQKSNFWKDIFNKLSFIEGLLNIYLYNFVYKIEVNKFGNEITNNKPKYLIDKTDDFLKILFKERLNYPKNKEGKEIIKNLDIVEGALYINEKKFKMQDSEKSEYFLSLLLKYFEFNYELEIDLYDFIELYDRDSKNVHTILNLSDDNIRKTYIKTINKQVLNTYDKEILEIKKGVIKFKDNVQEMF